MSKRQLENYGECVLSEFSPDVLQTPQPTNIDNLITDYMGFNFEYQYLSNNGVYLGVTVFDDTDTLPIYNPELNRAEFLSVKRDTIIIEGTLAENPALEHRERFTEGHEASHGLVHHEYYRQRAQFAGFSNTGDSYSKPCFPDLSGVDTNGRRLQGEAWLEWQANYLASVLLMPKGKRNWHSDLISTMVEVYNVSKNAARVRLNSLNYLLM